MLRVFIVLAVLVPLAVHAATDAQRVQGSFLVDPQKKDEYVELMRINEAGGVCPGNMFPATRKAKGRDGTWSDVAKLCWALKAVPKVGVDEIVLLDPASKKANFYPNSAVVNVAPSGQRNRTPERVHYFLSKDGSDILMLSNGRHDSSICKEGFYDARRDRKTLSGWTKVASLCWKEGGGKDAGNVLVVDPDKYLFSSERIPSKNFARFKLQAEQEAEAMDRQVANFNRLQEQERRRRFTCINLGDIITCDE